jgi:hypothetical protein
MRATVFLTFAVATVAIGSAARGLDAPGLVFGAQRRGILEEAARDKDFDSLVQALGENHREHEAYIQPLSGGGSPNSRFHLMLRDCRIAKLRSYIQAKPAAEQAAIAERLFDSCIEAYEAELKSRRDQPDGPYVVTAATDCRHDAALAMLLLCTDFCDAKSVLEKVDYMKAVIERNHAARVDLGLGTKPDAAYLRNLYLYLLEIQFPESVADPDVRYAISGNGADRRRAVAILYWDLASNSILATPKSRPACRVFEEFSGMGHEKTDQLHEKRLRAVVDKYVAQADLVKR